MEKVHYVKDRADVTTLCGRIIDYKWYGLEISQNIKNVNCKHCLRIYKSKSQDIMR